MKNLRNTGIYIEIDDLTNSIRNVITGDSFPTDNLVAFACKLSFQRGHEGNVAFISKSQLIDHYIESLGAVHFGGRLMIIDKNAALQLINKYFTNIS